MDTELRGECERLVCFFFLMKVWKLEIDTLTQTWHKPNLQYRDHRSTRQVSFPDEHINRSVITGLRYFGLFQQLASSPDQSAKWCQVFLILATLFPLENLKIPTLRLTITKLTFLLSQHFLRLLSRSLSLSSCSRSLCLFLLVFISGEL